MMKCCIRLYCERTGNDSWANLLEALVGNVGLVFTKGDLSVVRDEIKKYVVGAPARVGLVAPKDVTVEARSTGLDPSQTSFFQVSPEILRSHPYHPSSLSPNAAGYQLQDMAS